MNEIISWGKRRRKKLVFLKVDFEKAFDSLKWSFLNMVMTQMGFSARWRKWINACLESVYVSAVVNGSPSLEFKNKKRT